MKWPSALGYERIVCRLEGSGRHTHYYLVGDYHIELELDSCCDKSTPPPSPSPIP